MNNPSEIIGSVPSSFDYSAGTDRYISLTRLDPNNTLLVPPPGAPLGTVGLPACEVLAGPGYGTYGRANTLDSLATWVVPLLILVVNFNYPAFDQQICCNRVAIALHLFGNPIHAMWALLTKLDVKRRIELRCRGYFLKMGLRETDIWKYSAILYALDDFDFSRDFENHFLRLMEIASSDNHSVKSACKRAAIDLTITRVKNTRRAVFAIFGYLAAITANIIRGNFSGNIALHYSHTIALRELNYWLIAAIILSAAVGGFPSEWTSVGILIDLQSKTGLDFNIQRLQPWRGGNPTWRPEKDLSVTISGVSDRRHLTLALFAFASVTLAAFISFIISYFTPTRGIGVRCIIEIVYWAWWCVNAIVMYTIGQYRAHWTTTERGWLITIVKDSIFALFTILFLLSAWNGWWNSCYCWSMAIQLGNSHAYIDFIGMKPHILWLMKKPFAVAMALGAAAQFVLGAAMIWYAQGGLRPAAMTGEDAAAYFMILLEEHTPPNARSDAATISIIEGVAVEQQHRSETALLREDACVVTQIPRKAGEYVREGG